MCRWYNAMSELCDTTGDNFTRFRSIPLGRVRTTDVELSSHDWRRASSAFDLHYIHNLLCSFLRILLVSVMNVFVQNHFPISSKHAALFLHTTINHVFVSKTQNIHQKWRNHDVLASLQEIKTTRCVLNNAHFTFKPSMPSLMFCIYL